VREPFLVSFAAVGPGKCGTTWLFDLLARHPGLTMCRAKEPMYFDRNHARGDRWYHGLFPPTRGPAGEMSNSYFASPLAPSRMAAYNAGMRVVVCVRDPVERAFSNYLFLARNGQVRGSFEAALEVRPDLLEHGRYGAHLARWLDAFPAEQVLVQGFEDLRRDPVAFAANVVRFAGADPALLPPDADAPRLVASAPRSAAAARLVKAGAGLARRAGAPALVTRAKQGALPRLVYRPFGPDRPVMADGTRKALDDYYAADLDLLGRLTARAWAGTPRDVSHSA
jgi:hypothetical protein